MCDIYRVFECRNGLFTEIAFLVSKESTETYLQICKQEAEPDQFYFAQKIKIEQ